MKSVAEFNAGATCLHPYERVEQAIASLAADINVQLAEASELLVLCVLKGGLVFSGLLLPQLRMPLQVDYVHVTRYGLDNSAVDGLDWIVPLRSRVQGRAVLVCDDIFDEGKTLSVLCRALLAAGAASVSSAVMVEKCHDRKVEGFKPDFVGLSVPDVFVLGMGMDYGGLWRNAPGIYAVNL
jgi:hypoxanthine phosphoribosyltransferase